MIDKLESNGKKRGAKRKKIFGLLLFFFLIMTGFIFLRANPHFENFLILFRASPYEIQEITRVEIDEMSEINKMIPLENGWIVHLRENGNDRMIFLDDNLQIEENMDLNSGSEISYEHGEYDYWLLLDPGENVMVFNLKGEMISEIDFKDGTKISKNEGGILLGKKEREINETLNYREELKWFDKEGELIKDLNFENFVVLEGIKNEYWEEVYLGMTFSESPKFKLIDQLEKTVKVLDFRIEENSRLFTKSREDIIVIGNEERLIQINASNRDVFEVGKEGEDIYEIFLLNGEMVVVITGNGIREKDKELSLLKITEGKFELKKQRPVRGSLLDIFWENGEEFVLATSTHMYNYDGKGFTVFQNPWGEIKNGAFNLKGDKFLAVHEETGELVLFKKEEKDNN